MLTQHGYFHPQRWNKVERLIQARITKEPLKLAATREWLKLEEVDLDTTKAF